MSKHKLFKNSPRMGGNEHPDILYRILGMVEHLVQHAHHIEDLIVAIGGTGADQEKVNAILAKTAQNKAKLQQSLEAKPPASDQSGTPSP